MGKVVVDVAGDKQVKAAITVVIAPGSAVGPVSQCDSGLLANIRKSAIVVIAIEAVFAEVGDEDVRPAIIVKVADRHTESPAVVGHACLGGHIGERAVVVVVKERGMRRCGFAGKSVVGGAVHEVNIKPAVIVV